MSLSSQKHACNPYQEKNHGNAAPLGGRLENKLITSGERVMDEEENCYNPAPYTYLRN